MADKVSESEFGKMLRIVLNDDKFNEVKALLEEADLLVLVNEKYRDWLKSQNNLQSCENDQDELKQREKIVAIFEKLVECCQTNISDREGWTEEEIVNYKKQSSVVLTACQCLLYSLWKKLNQIDTGNPHSYRKFLIKKIACCLVSLCAANLEEHSWSSTDSRLTAHELLSFICTHCQCSSISELLSGDAEFNSGSKCTHQDTSASEDTSTVGLVFPSGLFRLVLDFLRPHLLKETWKKSPIAYHALVWCTMQIKHPFVGDHFPKLMSPLLLLIDDYKVDNKVLGLKCLRHVVENMNSAELQWYGRADVLFEAIQRHLYTSEPSVVKAVHPCLISILKAVELSPTKPKFGRKTNKFDSTFQIVLSSMEFESKLAMRRAYASHLKNFIEHMGITTLRHFKRLLRVMVSYLEVSDYPNEEARLGILDALHTTMLHAWPRIPHHSLPILKCLLKLLVDLTDSAPHLTAQAYQQLRAKTSDCLLVLLICCGTPVQEQLRELTKGVGHSEVEDCVTNVLGEFEGEKTDVSAFREQDVI